MGLVGSLEHPHAYTEHLSLPTCQLSQWWLPVLLLAHHQPENGGLALKREVGNFEKREEELSHHVYLSTYSFGEDKEPEDQRHMKQTPSTMLGGSHKNFR